MANSISWFDVMILGRDKPPNPLAPDDGGRAARRLDLDRLGWRMFILSLFAAVMSWMALQRGMVAAFGICILIALAAFLAGCALGFIFGVPRTLTQDSPPAPAPAGAAGAPASPASAARRLLQSNTNLERISDWLATMLVGVTLTQLSTINDLLVRFSDLLAKNAKVFEPKPGVFDAGVIPLVGCVVLIFGAVAGFLFMYLNTRLILTPLFGDTETGLADPEAVAAKEFLMKGASATLDRGVAATPQATLDVAKSIADATPVPGDADSQAKIGLAQAIIGRFDEAADNLKAAVQQNPTDARLASTTARVLAKANRTQEADRLITSAPTPSAADEALNRMFIALYKTPPQGYQEALQIAATLSDHPDVTSRPEYWFYKTAALGQQHHDQATSTPPAPADVLAATRQAVLDAARQTVAIDPRFRQQLALLSSGASSDDDLVDFKTDTDFQGIANGTDPATPTPTGVNADGTVKPE